MGIGWHTLKLKKMEKRKETTSGAYNRKTRPVTGPRVIANLVILRMIILVILDKIKYKKRSHAAFSSLIHNTH